MKKSLGIGLMVFLMSFALAISAFGADRLIVQDSQQNITFKVTDAGESTAVKGIVGNYLTGTPFVYERNLSLIGSDSVMRIWRIHNTYPAAFELMYSRPSAPETWLSRWDITLLGTDNRGFAFRDRHPSLPGGGLSRLFINSSGYIGIGTETPTNPLQMASGARCTTGGVWTNASSRDYKENIKELSSSDALLAFNKLTPVTFNYKIDSQDKHVGFIAEDVPELVATPDKKALSPMDIVALLTKVVQEQQKTIADLNEKVTRLEQQVK